MSKGVRLSTFDFPISTSPYSSTGQLANRPPPVLLSPKKSGVLKNHGIFKTVLRQSVDSHLH